MSKVITPHSDDARRRKLLEAAVSVFLRFGFRKTSMDEVARAAQVSRQGLYLHFATKEELFRAAVRFVLEVSGAGVAKALEDDSLTTKERLVNAFDAWVGPFIGTWSANAADLGEFSNSLVEGEVLEAEQRFAEQITKALRPTAKSAVYKSAGINAKQVADTLIIASRGLKHQCSTRHQFVEAMRGVVGVICAPLEENEP